VVQDAVQDAVQDVQEEVVKKVLSWQPFIDSLQTYLSKENVNALTLNSDETKFIQSICTDPSGTFLKSISSIICGKEKENINIADSSKLIVFIYKKIKDTHIPNVRLSILLNFLLSSFIESKLLVVENVEEIKKHATEMIDLLELTHVMPDIKVGCFGCILS